MGKQIERRRSELAKQVMEVTDKTTLDGIEHALLGAPPMGFTEKDIRDLEGQLARIERGEESTYSWAEVKKRLARKPK